MNVHVLDGISGKNRWLTFAFGSILVLSCACVITLIPKAAATTTEFTSNTSFSGTVNASDTLIIDKGVTVTSNGITNKGNITNAGTIQMNNNTLENYGIVLNNGSGQISSSINNYQSGTILNQNVDFTVFGQHFLNNYGNFTTYGGIRASYNAYINNYASGVIQSYNSGELYQSQLTNYGLVKNYGYLELDWGQIYTNGTFNNHANIYLFSVQGDDGITNGAGGTFNNLAGSQITIPTRTGGYRYGFFNYGLTNNAGSFSNADQIKNWNVFNNNGTLSNTSYGGNGFQIATITNYGTFNNNPAGTINNNSVFTKECGAVFNNHGTLNGNPVVDTCTDNLSTTTVTPNPAFVALYSTKTFLVTVNDTSSSPTTPTGTISWSDGGAGGKFNSSSCTLTSSSFSASKCSIVYTTPSSAPAGKKIIINATYSGDGIHGTSSGTSALSVTKRPTTTGIAPNPSSAVYGGIITYTATITDASSGTKSAPGGTVSWSDGNMGGAFSSNMCTLITISSSQSHCTITYTSSGAGSVTITAKYFGDAIHTASSHTSALIVS